MKDMNVVDWVAFVLVIVGGVNWGLVGLLNMNVVNLLLGSVSILEKIVYDLVGLSALWMLYSAFKK
ncbi:MAG: DUF378 domain-containing protein [archaeon]